MFKGGDNSPNSASSYRPISLLSLPSKLLERVVHNKLMGYLLSNNLLSSRQFGFRPGGSTQEALLYATNDWHIQLDQRSSVAAILIDLFKAFDRVPHHDLITTLSSIGIHGTLLTWFASYLTNRSQQVVLDGHSSATSPVSSGVPQGSILGPLLFSIYLNPLANIPLSRNSKLIMYADDIVLYRPIHSPIDVEVLQTDVDQVAAWITSADLSLNCNKTKLMVLSHKRSPPTVHVRLPDASVIP